VEIRTNTPIGPDLTLKDLRNAGYEAIFIAIGTHKSKRLDIEGEDLEGVFHASGFLHDIGLGKKVDFRGKIVVVVGGGNVAIDVARSALRIGGEEIHVMCVESREEMPAFKQEIEEAEEEGIIIHTRRMPKRIIGVGGRAVGVETLECISVFDSEGRFNPQVKPNTESILEADTVIVAIGQEVDYTLLKAADGLLVTKGGLLQVDGVTQQTNIPGIFAAGDAVAGPGLVIQAIAQGHEAAISIDRYLRGEDLKKERGKKELEVAPLPERKIPKQPRVKIPVLPVEERIDNFKEVELELTEEMAVKEAMRCMNCNICSVCKQCEESCEADAVQHEMDEETIELDVGAIVVATGYDLYDPLAKPEYGYGKYSNVITGLEFERLASSSGPTEGHIEINGKEPKKVVFIQCVGSRDRDGNEYCSRVCCMYTAKQAHLVKEKIPNAELTIYYTDMRAFGKGFEEFYNRVQGEGVTYRRRELEDPIEVTGKSDHVVVKAKGYPDVEADLVVLATGITPREDTKELARLLNINQSADGFLLEAHPKLRPVDTFTDGIFLAGCCQGPKDIPDAVAQAGGAAVRASEPLAQGKVEVEAISSVIDEDLCSGCRVCENLCAYSALEFDSENKVIKVNDVMCKGCGSCASACPTGAVSMRHFNVKQILAQIGGIIGGV
jgi:heterodisulfide reductase subunit A